MSAVIEHLEPEENYGGGEDYYDEEEYSEEEYVEEELVEEYEEEVVDEVVADEVVEEEAPQGGMAAMIAAAANKRTNRLDQGGEKKVTHVEKPANESMDMAAMIAKRAQDRNERIEAGGELQVREVPKEHQNVFVDIALEAARVGTLTRLNEHTVVAVAQAKEEEVWGGPSGLRTDNLRSHHFMAIHEAAALGALKMRKPVETTNYDQHEYHEEEEPEDVDKMTDEHGRRVVRQLYLIDQRLEEERKYKKEEWSAENAVDQVHHDSVDEVELPSATAPTWKPKKTEKNRKDLMDQISAGVAERAWERNYRLNRPKAMLQVTRKCNCRFCLNPNPFQTHKYKQMGEKGLVVTDGPLMEVKEVDQKKKKWTPTIKQTHNVKPGEWSEASAYTPLPTAVPKFKPARPPPKPIADKKPEPAKAPEPEPVQEMEEETGEPGVVILLDETTTWGHKREKTPKPKKDSKKKKKKKKKGGGGGGCAIM